MFVSADNPGRALRLGDRNVKLASDAADEESGPGLGWPAREPALSSPVDVILNGKFFVHEMTGVHRVGTELVRHLLALVAKDDRASRAMTPQVWVSAKGARRAREQGIPARVIRPLDGLPWGQLTLPALSRGKMIVSLCNVGPIAYSNAITMIQDAQVHDAPSSYDPLFRAWYRFHQPIAGRKHRRILTISEYSRNRLAKCGIVPSDRCTVIPNGVDHVLREPPDPTIIMRLGVKPNGFVVALANVQPHKNLSLLCKAFSDPSLAHLKLVLFGHDDLAAFIKAGIAVPSNVVFAGRLSDAELWGLYGEALCLACPSHTEGFGLPPLEAMMTFCPVIASDTGALPETCGPSAAYASPHDPAQWVQRILELDGDLELRKRMRNAGKAWASRYRWADSAQRLLDVILEETTRSQHK